jgi:hypothetical protein
MWVSSLRPSRNVGVFIAPQYPLEDICNTITAVVRQNPGVFKASSWLPALLERDFSLALYALAQLYVRQILAVPVQLG